MASKQPKQTIPKTSQLIKLSPIPIKRLNLLTSDRKRMTEKSRKVLAASRLARSSRWLCRPSSWKRWSSLSSRSMRKVSFHRRGAVAVRVGVGVEAKAVPCMCSMVAELSVADVVDRHPSPSSSTTAILPCPPPIRSNNIT